MFKNILIGTAFTLVAASTTFTPAFAKSVPLNYADPCRTAFENFNQANWEKAHRTDQGNLGGAKGWDELADAAERNAKTQSDRAEEHRANAAKATPNPNQSDFWNNRAAADADFWTQQAVDAAGEAKEWADRAAEHRKQAQKMRDDAKDYNEVARKALKECEERLNAIRTAELLLEIEDIMTIGKPLNVTPEQSAQTEKKPEKKPVRKAQSEGGKKKPKPVKVKKPPSASQQAAQSIARDVAVSVVSQLILGEISGLGYKNNQKHHKLDRHQKMERQAMGEGKSRRKMKRNKRMSMF